MIDEIFDKMKETFNERGKIYGNNYQKIGDVMYSLFPQGLKLTTPDEWNKFHLWFIALVKMTRLASTNFDHADSAHDIAVYGVMLESESTSDTSTNNETTHPGFNQTEWCLFNNKKHALIGMFLYEECCFDNNHNLIESMKHEYKAALNISNDLIENRTNSNIGTIKDLEFIK